jgi:hypothetical protein
MWRRVALAFVLVLLGLPVLAVLVVGWLVSGCLYWSTILGSKLSSLAKGLGAHRLGDMLKGFAIVSAILLVGGFWVASHVDPEEFGTCHTVVLQVGDEPTASECDPYNAADFAIPIGVVVLLIFVLSEDVMKLGIPGVFTLERAKKEKEAKKAAQSLDEEASDRLRRIKAFEQYKSDATDQA